MTLRWDDERWTLAHDLALLFVALAYGTDRRLSDDEICVIAEALAYWQPDASDETIREVIVAATTILMEEGASSEVHRAIARLGQELSESNLSQVLAQVNHIAEADGILLQREEHLIGALAEAWSLRGLETPQTADPESDWGMLHQMAFIYVVVAHSADDELHADEIEAIIDRLRGWDGNAPDETVRNVVRDALAFYAQEPDEKVLGQTIMTLKNTLPPMRRLILLDDLYYIAHADGSFTEHEREMITSLAEAWGVSIRLNGTH